MLQSALMAKLLMGYLGFRSGEPGCKDMGQENHCSSATTTVMEEQGDLTEFVKLRCPFILCHQRVMGKASSAKMCFNFSLQTLLINKPKADDRNKN